MSRQKYASTNEGLLAGLVYIDLMMEFRLRAVSLFLVRRTKHVTEGARLLA